MTKTYGINGIVEASFLFPAGQGHLRAEFNGGILDEKRTRPATMTTTNQVAMLIIENSDMYRLGQIFIVAKSEDAPSMAAPVETEEKKAEKAKRTKADAIKEDGRKVYESVTTLGDAVNILMDLGAKAAGVADAATALETAAAMNVSFPNLKLK